MTAETGYELAKHRNAEKPESKEIWPTAAALYALRLSFC